MCIELDTLMLVRYDETKYKSVKEKFESTDSSSVFIGQIGERLENSKVNAKTLFQSAFVILDGQIPIGYLFISSMIKDEVFLEYAILREYRQMGYATRVVSEVSDYLFNYLNIRSIKLDIDPSNKNSILVAEKCGYFIDDDDYETRNFSGKIKFIKESDCYIPRRRKGY